MLFCFCFTFIPTALNQGQESGKGGLVTKGRKEPDRALAPYNLEPLKNYSEVRNLYGWKKTSGIPVGSETW